MIYMRVFCMQCTYMYLQAYAINWEICIMHVYIITERFFKPETRLAQKERRQACVQRIAEMCARRIEWPNSRRAPLVSDELLSILIDEVKKKHRRKPRTGEHKGDFVLIVSLGLSGLIEVLHNPCTIFCHSQRNP